MKILIAHNSYQQPGGEDTVFDLETRLLAGAGHEVSTLLLTNDSIGSGVSKIQAALGSIYSRNGYWRMAAALDEQRPDVVHVHNPFPLLSPSIFYATKKANVPVVWTLHNYRTFCANGLLFRDGKSCEECLGRLPFPAVAHRCYRGSAAGSAVVATSIAVHSRGGTWLNKVDRFIALTEFSRSKFVQAGLPAEKISVKPNFVPDPPRVEVIPQKCALFIGRLSVEKGVKTLVDSWRNVDKPLFIIGDGPDRLSLEQSAPANVHFLGHLPRDAVLHEMAAAEIIIVPSIWYENCPMVVVEAMALGKPIVASRIGALAEIIQDDVSGLLFKVGDRDDLARAVNYLFSNDAVRNRLSTGARNAYINHFSPEASLKDLLDIYGNAIAEKPAIP